MHRTMGVYRLVLLQVSAVQTAQLPFKRQASQFCAGSIVFIELSETELRAQSGVHHTVVLGSIMNDKSIQKGTIPSSTVTQQKLRETYRRKSSVTKNYKSHGCIQQSAVDGWYSSNLSYENIKSTEVTAHNVYESVKRSQFPLVLGQKTVLKHVFLNRQKHVYFKLKQYAPNMRTSLCSLSFSSPWHVIFCSCSLYNWKQITDIYFGDTTFSCFHLKNVHFLSNYKQLYSSRCMQAIFSAQKQKAGHHKSIH